MNYEVKKISAKTAKEYIIKNHYSHGCHNAPSLCCGLYENDDLVGVLMFAVPCSENVRASVFGSEYKDTVIELHRLHILDITPKNTESWFISRCLKLLKNSIPKIKAVISFSDTTQGHEGIIYKATNFYFIGKTPSRIFYIDNSGRLRHPRQNSKNITKGDAAEYGWTPVRRSPKNRYLIFLPSSKAERKKLIAMCKYDVINKNWCIECGKEISKSEGKICSRCRKKNMKERGGKI